MKNNYLLLTYSMNAFYPLLLLSLFFHFTSSQFSLEDLAENARISWIHAEHELHQATLPETHHDLEIENIPDSPLLPSKFKAKGRVTIKYANDGVLPRELLAIYHYDYPLRKTRLDVYYIHEQNITRYFTDIRDYKKLEKAMIFHRVQNQALSSPHSCLIVPLKHNILHPRVIVDRGKWLRKVQTEIHAHNASLSVPTNQWEIISSSSTTTFGQPINTQNAYDGSRSSSDVWHYYSSISKNEPVRLVRYGKNTDIYFIDFQKVNVHPIGMFNYDRVSSVKCVEYKGKHRRL